MLRSPLLGRTSTITYQNIRKTAGQQVTDFRLGDVFKGRIISTDAKGLTLISVNGVKFLANTEVSLSEGKSYHFQVKRVQPRIELNVAGGKIPSELPGQKIAVPDGEVGRALTKILMELANTRDLTRGTGPTVGALEKLRQILPSIVYMGKGNEDASWLSRALKASGIFWENTLLRQLAGKAIDQQPALDLKGLLLTLRKGLEKEPVESTQTDSLLSKVRQALGLIERDQVQNTFLIKDGGWFWHVYGTETSGLRDAEIFGRKTGKEKEYNLSIWLDLSHLGEVEANVSLVDTSIGVRFLLEDEEKVHLIRENLRLLDEAMKNKGLQVRQLTCDVKQQDDAMLPPSRGVEESPTIHVVV